MSPQTWLSPLPTLTLSPPTLRVLQHQTLSVRPGQLTGLPGFRLHPAKKPHIAPRRAAVLVSVLFCYLLAPLCRAANVLQHSVLLRLHMGTFNGYFREVTAPNRAFLFSAHAALGNNGPAARPCSLHTPWWFLSRGKKLHHLHSNGIQGAAFPGCWAVCMMESCL